MGLCTVFSIKNTTIRHHGVKQCFVALSYHGVVVYNEDIHATFAPNIGGSFLSVRESDTATPPSSGDATLQFAPIQRARLRIDDIPIFSTYKSGDKLVISLEYVGSDFSSPLSVTWAHGFEQKLGYHGGNGRGCFSISPETTG